LEEIVVVVVEAWSSFSGETVIAGASSFSVVIVEHSS
jgi:hypothetical protein